MNDYVIDDEDGLGLGVLSAACLLSGEEDDDGEELLLSGLEVSIPN